MWLLFAFGSALFAGLTAILAKCGIRNTDSNVATALRTGVVLVFSWLMVFVVGAQSEIRDVSAKVLYSTQPSVSKVIKSLEDTLGMQFFERLPKS